MFRYEEFDSDDRTVLKDYAYTLDKEAWVSYPGKPLQYKRAMEVRRSKTLA